MTFLAEVQSPCSVINRNADICKTKDPQETEQIGDNAEVVNEDMQLELLRPKKAQHLWCYITISDHLKNDRRRPLGTNGYQAVNVHV